MTKASLALPLDMPAALTPVMAQYKKLKDAHPDCLLFFQMGDFFELFFDDAVQAAPKIDVALTQRDGTPMCGVPVHAYEVYMPKLIEAGFRVAIAQQLENPEEAKKRGGSKAIVDRQVVRIITPGTLTEDRFLEAKTNNYLAVMSLQGGQFGLAWCDLCEGVPYVSSTGLEGLNALLARVNPGELVVPLSLQDKEDWKEFLSERRDSITLLPNSRFDSANAEARALAQYNVASLDGFGNFGRAGVAALGVLLDYIALTQKQSVRLSPPQMANENAAMAIDPATRRNLEFTVGSNATRKGSLLDAIDMTATALGARLLCDQLCAPLCEVSAINQRLDRVSLFVEQGSLREKLREALKACPDLARALARLSLKRGGPRDLALIKNSVEATARMGYLLDTERAQKLNADVLALRRSLGEYSALAEKLGRALKNELPILTREGGFIAPGFSPAFDELVTLRDDSKRHIAGLQAKYVAATKIANLRIRHNNVIGYHVEITPTQADKLMQPPHNEVFIHRQTLQSGVRFTTTELADLERKVSDAADKALALELEIFNQLCDDVLNRMDDLRGTCSAIAQLDVASSLAELATRRHWCRPVVDTSLEFKIEKGRHPVVEAALDVQGAQAFTPNDCDLSAQSRLWLVTGPNMAGKSTFLRQNALIAALAQMGSFVPALSAHIGVVDRLFSRVGAADDLARGRSTFMVEMVETSAILNQAGERALVILDEIGRGTATYDGLSIAWAVVEYLYHHNRSRALFATHYHELTALKEPLPALYCATAMVREWENSIVFLHEIKGGVADRSYGIHVAQLAGLPEAVITRASTILKSLENKESGGKITLSTVSSSDFQKQNAPEKSALEKALAALEPDALSPKEALEQLYALKKLAK